MNRNESVMLKEIEGAKKKAQIANIIEELEQYDHGLPAINTVYLILMKTRIKEKVTAEAVE